VRQRYIGRAITTVVTIKQPANGQIRAGSIKRDPPSLFATRGPSVTAATTERPRASPPARRWLTFLIIHFNHTHKVLIRHELLARRSVSAEVGTAKAIATGPPVRCTPPSAAGLC
jgi:hypothetical protein